MTTWSEATEGSEPLTFERVPFDHPLWVLFSSGTTGVPKGIVHGHGGIVLDHLRAGTLQFDAQLGEPTLVVATTSWMVWNVHVSGLLAGETLVILGGNPMLELDRIWRVTAQQRVGRLGIGAGYILASMKADLRPAEQFDLSSLRQIGPAGSPLPADGYHWISQRVGKHVWPAAGSGGTDVCAAYVGGVPILPVRAGRMQAACSGVAIEAWGEDGRPVPPGTLGELVITKPMPSMPLLSLGRPRSSSPQGDVLLALPEAWRQGDFIEFDTDGSCNIPGRSDSTLNRRGVRIGPAELYSVVERLPEVTEALVVGRRTRRRVLHAAVHRGRRRRRRIRPARADRRRDPRRAHTASRTRRDHLRARDPAHQDGQEARGADQTADPGRVRRGGRRRRVDRPARAPRGLRGPDRASPVADRVAPPTPAGRSAPVRQHRGRPRGGLSSGASSSCRPGSIQLRRSRTDRSREGGGGGERRSLRERVAPDLSVDPDEGLGDHGRLCGPLHLDGDHNLELRATVDLVD